jgi:uncharacterized Zn-binding protein involved in type VI secretion
MTFPAGRLGDMTGHGGVITLGFPMVLIGGMPAARVTDIHVCPMLTGPAPHVGGPVTMGGNMVLIGNMPASRSTSIVTCAGPPDVLTMGCPTVLVGDAGGGSGGGGGGGGGAGNDAGASASVAVSGGNTSTEGPHWITFVFVDSGGTPLSGIPYSFTDPDGVETQSRLSSNGTVSWRGEATGQGTVTIRDISNARWSQESASVGDTLTLSADVEGYESGTSAFFDIYIRDVSGPDELVTTIETEVQGNSVETEWELEYDPSEAMREAMNVDSYSLIKYYFIVRIEREKARSGYMEYTDWLNIDLVDDEGNPVPNVEYMVYLSNGEIRRGTLDGNGHAREEDLPPGGCRVRFPNDSNIAPS